MIASKKEEARGAHACARKERERESERAAFPRPFLINHLFEKIQHRVSLSRIGEEKKFARERYRLANINITKKHVTKLTLVACRTALSSLPEMLSP
jgi:hypothetical protein